MDGKTSATHIYLEHMLLDESVKPTKLPLSLLEAITNNFSDDQEIGRGGFAVVYKGILRNGMIAVKKLSKTLDMHEKNFVQEVQCLMKVRHKNIVRFLGYCADTQGEMADYEGKSVLAEVRNRLLCFEFVPKGSLYEHITDASCGLEWRVRYQLIKGICEGLHYLHENHIVHLDLKPGNIFLDNNMVPKIADFGLSRCFDENQSRAITSKLIGSVGYMAPEFYNGQITFKLDMYSLGVIVMEMLTGQKGYSTVDKVFESWRNRLEIQQQDTSLHQVRSCVDIGIACMDPNPDNRPATQYIMDKLSKLESSDEFSEDAFSLNGFEKESHHKDDAEANKEPTTVNGTNKNRINYFISSMPHVMSTNEILGQHEQQIQRADNRSNEQYKESILTKERESTMKVIVGSRLQRMYKSMVRWNESRGVRGELVAAGWPAWLVAVAAETVHGWQPRRPDSFEKIDKIGEGMRSSMYKARDYENGKIVALKKVRFDNLNPESVRFMAREIHILRRLNHPNVAKLEGLVTSRMSNTLYLVFEYMEHDLAGLAATPGFKFTEPQVKCYMRQLLSGLDHCHNRGVLHRDIKGVNLLLDNNGILKIADFGIATFFNPNQQNQRLTSRVVTLWYRPPELLLGATNYGAAVDLWTAGCILAELLSGKPIMPGRTEVEQLHKIFKLCGSPSEEFWANLKLSRATIFKPQHPYRRSVNDVYKDFPTTALALLDRLLAVEPDNRGTAASALDSEFFTTKPYACDCDPSSPPKYPPSKEYDAKLRDEEARRQRTAAKGQEAEAGRRKQFLAPDGNSGLQVNGTKNNRIHYSGPLMLTGVKMDEILREHERRIQQSVRRARLDKGKGKHNSERDQSEALLYTTGNIRADP